VQDVYEAWAERVSEAMGDMTISQLARRCGVTTPCLSRFISGMKNGERRNPSDELKWKIAGALHERMDRLFAYPNVVPPAPDANGLPEVRRLKPRKPKAPTAKKAA
jgi:transcriptional regulator with XRE-family HTH domain